MRALSLLIFSATTAILVASSACGDSDTPDEVSPTTAASHNSSERPSWTSAVAQGGGEGAEPYESPIIREDGEWIPPAFVPYTQQAIRDDWDRIQGAPLIGGDVQVNGFRFFRAGDPGYREPELLCKFEDAPLNEGAGEDDLPFKIEYFPPGTTEAANPAVRHCSDGRLFAASRAFRIGPATFYVSYMAGEKAVNFLPFAEKVKPFETHGEHGVLVEPMVYGSGASIVLWPYANGFMRVDGNSIPLEELLKIVDGVVTED